ncbi:UNVERIFIED_CONTAM: hypothetical protein GTU68_020037 [Idotea baltica]|nr:hypothetical protein [Idotea baltica]
METWVAQIAGLRQKGYDVVLVSSGSVAEGCVRLGWPTRPVKIHELQAAASVGQMGLIQAYEQEFQNYDEQTGQVLLTHDDLSNRERYLNARSTLETLLDLDVIPVINENDTVVTDEIRFGDNDTLAGLVANLIVADALVILTDQDGLFQEDPRVNPDAELVHEACAGLDNLQKMASGSAGSLGRGGMLTKVNAAKLAQRSGTDTVICSGREGGVLGQIANGDEVGTLLYADQAPVNARKQWLAGQLQVKGTLVLDDGAKKVLVESGRSLLPVGVVSISGDFRRGHLVSCVDKEGAELARGLVNFNSAEAAKIIGKPSSEILEVLGYCDHEEMIHRNNLTLLDG